MTRRRALPLLLVWAAFLVAAPPSEAGRTCEPASVSSAELGRRVEWALEIRRHLEALDPQLALVARVGSDVSKYGLKYTHMGFVWRDHPKGRWGLVHMLNTCGEATSDVYDQGLLNFLLDDPFRLDVLILVPTPELQAAIVRRLENGAGLRFRNAAYSMIAYPFSTRYQNSNQWLLEIVAAAESDLSRQPVADRAGAQALYRRSGYRGTALRISGFERAFAGLGRANVRFEDHPAAAARDGRYETVTVESVRAYLDRRGLVQNAEELIYRGPFERTTGGECGADSPPPCRSAMNETTRR